MSIVKDIAELKKNVGIEKNFETKLAMMQKQIDHMAALLEKELDYTGLPKRHKTVG